MKTLSEYSQRPVTQHTVDEWRQTWDQKSSIPDPIAKFVLSEHRKWMKKVEDDLNKMLGEIK